MRKLILLLSLLVGTLTACIDEPQEVNYRIVSPTPRPRLEVTQVPTVVAQELTRVAATDTLEPPTATPTETEPTATATLTTEAVATTPAISPTAAVTEAVATDAPTAESTSAETTPADAGGAATPPPASNNDELRQLQQDRNFLVRAQIDQTCYLTNEEIPMRVTAQNFGEAGFYLYLRGQLLFSINNSPLGPDFPPPEPSVREDFVRLETEQSHTWQLEDLGLYIQGMGPESGINFGDTFLGLPPGDYWLTVAYSNDKDGLTEQIDGTFLIPDAAWQGIAVSREIRFTVVADLADCPS